MGSKRGSAAKGGAKKGQQQKKQGFIAGPRGFVREVQGELKRVNWPDRETTKNLTLVVIAVSIVLGLLLGGIDFVLQNIFAAVP